MRARRGAIVGLMLGVAWPLMIGPASAAGVIEWTGHGADVLPCESGGHWVLAPSFGIDSATLTVDGVEHVMAENGQGSWAADSSGAIGTDVEAFVTYEGDGDERDHLQLSHCVAGESPSPTPTETPSPDPTPTPSDTPAPDPSPSTHRGGGADCTVKVPGGVRSYCKTPVILGATPTGNLAQTGIPGWLVALPAVLLVIGGALRLVSRRRAG